MVLERIPIDPTSPRVGLHFLPEMKPLYILPKDPLLEEVLIPCFRTSTHVDIMMGFFSSHVLADLAPGLATFIRSHDGVIRLIISPHLSEPDISAIQDGVASLQDKVEDILQDLLITSDYIQEHTLKCLTWLLRNDRIDLKIAIMKSAIFHPKVWLFKGQRDSTIAVHGSSNMTHSGIKGNIEQVSVSKSWEEGDHYYITDRFKGQFSELWEDGGDDCVIIDIPDAIRGQLLRTYSSDIPPRESDLHDLYAKAALITNSNKIARENLPIESSNRNEFTIPSGLRYKDGPFAHQGKAVKAWCDAGYRGVLEMATGSGKTITAMIAAHRLYEKCKPILIVVSAPYVPLIQQWCEEIAQFGIRPVNISEAGGPRKRAEEMGRLRRQLRNKLDVGIVVASHTTLADDGFKDELRRFGCEKLLIADEAHNLGSEGFILDPPTFFDHRLGLSATPVRQFDKTGTEALFEFLGPVVFTYSLEEAIGKCLVEYEYFVHPVELTTDEMDRWFELTQRVQANHWRTDKDGNPDEFLKKLLIARRAILEVAKRKIDLLEELLAGYSPDDLRHTLIYTSDKNPEQMEDVNQLLMNLDILFHPLTYEETRNRRKTKEIIREFQGGSMNIITAKRVLDEGVNIPQIKRAFIMASTTVERQWIQRRGRLLRKCEEIGKTYSEIHDFVVIPSGMGHISGDIKALINSELERIQAFARLARNAGRPTGPLRIVDQLLELYKRIKEN